jgi:hypothetical protein
VAKIAQYEDQLYDFLETQPASGSRRSRTTLRGRAGSVQQARAGAAAARAQPAGGGFARGGGSDSSDTSAGGAVAKDSVVGAPGEPLRGPHPKLRAPVRLDQFSRPPTGLAQRRVPCPGLSRGRAASLVSRGDKSPGTAPPAMRRRHSFAGGSASPVPAAHQGQQGPPPGSPLVTGAVREPLAAQRVSVLACRDQTPLAMGLGGGGGGGGGDSGSFARPRAGAGAASGRQSPARLDAGAQAAAAALNLHGSSGQFASPWSQAQRVGVGGARRAGGWASSGSLSPVRISGAQSRGSPAEGASPLREGLRGGPALTSPLRSGLR